MSGDGVLLVDKPAGVTSHDVVARERRALGGGGHRRAAGFSTDLSFDELVKFLREQVATQLA